MTGEHQWPWNTVGAQAPAGLLPDFRPRKFYRKVAPPPEGEKYTGERDVRRIKVDVALARVWLMATPLPVQDKAAENWRDVLLLTLDRIAGSFGRIEGTLKNAVCVNQKPNAPYSAARAVDPQA